MIGIRDHRARSYYGVVTCGIPHNIFAWDFALMEEGAGSFWRVWFLQRLKELLEWSHNACQEPELPNCRSGAQSQELRKVFIFWMWGGDQKKNKAGEVQRPYMRLYGSMATPIHWHVIYGHGCFGTTIEKSRRCTRVPYGLPSWEHLLSGWLLQKFAKQPLPQRIHKNPFASHHIIATCLFP